jgi:hypothetical protein
MPSVIEILAGIFGGPPVLPPAYDPGFSPPSTKAPPLQYPDGYVPGGSTQPGASAGGAMGPLDPNSPGYQAGTAARGVVDNLTGALDRIGIDLHNGIEGFKEGLPIFGTFAVLLLVFAVGLVMFMAGGGEGGRARGAPNLQIVWTIC